MNPIPEPNIGNEMIPFAVEDLTALVMQKKKLPIDDALHYLYTSDLYRTLTDEPSKLWYESTLSLYNLLEKEKSKARTPEKCIHSRLMFNVFCIEKYRTRTGLTAQETLRRFSDHHVFEFLDDTFDTLHTQDDAYIVDTITAFIKNGKRKK